MNKAVTAPDTSEHRFLSHDATPIFYRQRTPAAPRGTAVVIHGMAEHSGRYQTLTETLAALRFRVLLPDLRGFGQSGGKRACLRRFEDYLEDLETLWRFIRRGHPQEPLLLLGHSFGGLIAAAWAARKTTPGLLGLVLSSPAFRLATPPPEWRSLIGLGLSYVAPDWTQPNRVDASFLAHDPEVPARYVKDPLVVSKISCRLYREFLGAMRQSRSWARRITAPSLVLQAGEDRIVSREETAAFFSELASPDKELTVYDGFYHEIFNEVGRQRVFDDLKKWISKRVSW